MNKGNKKMLSIFVALLMLCTFIVPVQTLADTVKNEVKITILGTSDMHGAINGWVYDSEKDYGNSGLARAATIVNQVREENPNTILLDNGDTVQGNILTDDVYNKDLTKPNPMMAVMNAMKYDAMTLGNHEFNFGLGLIDKIVKEAKFPILSANTYKKADDTNYVKPYVVKEYDGVKVGILGLTVPSVPRWDGAKVKDLEFKHMADEAEKWVKVLKEEEKVDIIVATSHAGLESRHEENGSDSARLIAERCPEIDVLLLGHDHITVKEEINGVLVAAPYKDREIVRFDINVEKKDGKWQVKDKTSELVLLKDIKEDAEIKKVGQPFHDETMKFLEGIIGKSSEDFHPASEVKGIPEAQIKDTAVIDFINQVQLNVTGADIAAAALFKPTSNFPKGDLTYADVFNVYQYANTLVGVEVTGKELKAYMEWSMGYYNTFKPGDLTISFNPNVRGYSYDMFAGVDYEVDISKPVGQRVVNLTFKGEPVKDDQVFKLAVNDYRYSGIGPEGSKLISGKPYFESAPESLRAYIKAEIEKQGTIEPKVDNNWKLIGYEWNEELRKVAVEAVNSGKLSIPKSSDGRTENVRSITERDLIAAGLHSEYDKVITIAHTNDTHSRIDDTKDTIGFAKIASKINDLRNTIGEENVLVFDAGDTLHGQPVITTNKGLGAVQIMNTIGYDVMVPGNHDFNYGQERLVELSKEMKFDLLSSNVVKKDGTSLLESYVIKEVNGLKIGIFGLSTPETTFKTHPKNVEGLTFKDPVEVAKKMVKELEGKTDLIIAVAHLGIHEGNDTSEKVAQNVKGIDLIVDGHSHSTLPQGKLVNDTLIVQTGEYDKNLGIVDIMVKKDGSIEIVPQLFNAIDDTSLVPDADVKAVIDGIKKEFDALTSEKVGATDVKLVGEREFVRTGETNMGNLITNSMLMVTGADLALTNGGGIRASIEAGDITKKDIITVLPFGNYIVTIEVTGQEILDALEVGIDEYPKAKGSFPHIAGMTMKFDPELEAGKKVIEVLVNGKSIEKDKTYVLATNDFIAAGGDNYVMFKDNPIKGEYPALDEAVIEYIQKNGTKNIEVEGRVTTGKAETKPEVKPEEPKKDVVYIVKSGDTLTKIATEYGTTYKELASYNKIGNPHLIYIGQKILIPAK